MPARNWIGQKLPDFATTSPDMPQLLSFGGLNVHVWTAPWVQELR